ncbi:hypothetical protein Pfo_022324 [Paulownia fortunei]|nr:hypothetical protein Pfo_022324 [Paulownia fortunei]
MSIIDICSPSLQSISLISVYAEKYILKCPTPLITAKVHFPIRKDDEAIVSFPREEDGKAIAHVPLIRDDDFRCWRAVMSILREVRCLTIQTKWLQVPFTKNHVSFCSVLFLLLV